MCHRIMQTNCYYVETRQIPLLELILNTHLLLLIPIVPNHHLLCYYPSFVGICLLVIHDYQLDWILEFSTK